MISRILKTRLARHLVYLLCTLMLLGGQPLMALQEHVQIVPGEERPEWFEPWLQGSTYREAWTGAGRWTGDSAAELLLRVGTWRDRAFTPAWDLLDSAWAVPSGPHRAAAGTPVAAGPVPVFAAAFLGQVEETAKDAEAADELAGPRTITKAEPLPSAPGLKIGASDFQPPKELLRQLTAKADLDQIPLVPGWNLLSIPEEPADTDPAVVLAPIAGAYTRANHWDNCDTSDHWKAYDPSEPAGSDLTALDHTLGFWIEATTPVDLPSDGALPASTTIQLCPGWNLIGYPAAQPRHVTNALHTIEGKYIRVFGFDASDADDPWEVYSVGVPNWANDLQQMVPGRGYWVLATEAAELTIANEGPDPIVDITSPEDLSVVTDFTDIVGTVDSPILERWRLTYERIGETEPVEIASGVAPVTGGVLGTFDPTLLLNGLYELKLEATDLDGRTVEDTIAVPVEGNMKIGHFTLSFIDLSIPVSGLSVEVIRTYDSRARSEVGDFGNGWRLDIRQGSYQNNRPPGDGWKIVNPGGPFGLPCTRTIETKSHLTGIRLSDQEIYRFEIRLADAATSIGGCFARAYFEYVDGPLPGAELEILSNDDVFFENESDHVIDVDTFQTFEPSSVRLRTIDGRVFDLGIDYGVNALEDANGNRLSLSPNGISHDAGLGIDFIRDSEGRIVEVQDLSGDPIVYSYDLAGDLRETVDRAGRRAQYSYVDHYLTEVVDPRGIRAVRNDYDDEGRLVAVTDGSGNRIEVSHDLTARREVITDRLGFARILTYDEQGNILQEIDQLANVTQRVYDSKRRLLSERNPLGNVTTFEYDSAGNPITMTDPLGNETRFTYDPSGNPTTIEDPLGNITASSYDDNGNMLSITDPIGHSNYFTYDERGNLLTESDGAGNVTRYEFDALGRQTKVVDAEGSIAEFSYNSAGDLTSETIVRTLPDGTTEMLTTSFVLDDLGRPVETILPDGTRTLTRYDLMGNVRSATDPAGRSLQMEYDEIGQRTRIIHPDGESTSFSYDEEGRLVAKQDRSGRATEFRYDAAGRRIGAIDPAGTTVSTVYDAAGRVLLETDERGATTTFSYNAAGRRTEIRDALGGVTRFTYDAAGRQIRVEDPLGRATGYAYDALGRRTEVALPNGPTIRTDYDARGLITAEIDQAGRRTEFEYDGLGRLLKVVDAMDEETRYEYDELSNRIATTDANGNTTRFEFDALGRRIAKVLPDGLRESYAYDQVGNLVVWTDLLGHQTTYTYDENDLMTSRNYSDGSSVSFTYTKSGMRASMLDARGLTTYAYDSHDRLVKSATPEGDSFSYTWDEVGNRSSTAVQARQGPTLSTSYEHDLLSRVSSVTDAAGGTYNLAYDLAGQRIELSHPNGVSERYSYDDMGRLAGLSSETSSGNVVRAFDYLYTPTGQTSQVTENGGTVRTFQYDDLNRLISEEAQDGQQLLYKNWFAYDSVGNRVEQGRLRPVGAESVTETITYSYDSRHRLITETSSVRDILYSWDDEGRLLSEVGTESSGEARDTRYVWDSQNRLAEVRLADGTSIQHHFDGDGVLLGWAATAPDGSEGTKDWLVDIDGPVSRVAALLEGGGATEGVTRLPRSMEILGFVSGSDGSEAVHLDALGSVRGVTNSSAELVARFDYQAFGEIGSDSGNEYGAFAASRGFGYAGEQVEPSGAYYLRARHMLPSVGRFASMDPAEGQLRQPHSQHPYLYASASPLDNSDPSGGFSLGSTLMSVAIAGLVNSMIGAAIGGLTGGPGIDTKDFWLKAAKDFLIGAATAPIGGVFGKVFFRLFKGSVFQPLLRWVGNWNRITLRGKSAFQEFLVRVSRFFVNTNKRYPRVQDRFMGRFMQRVSKVFFPNVRWEQHHVFVQQFWSRAANGLFPGDDLAHEGLRRIGNGLWNLLPIPRSLNQYFGRNMVAAEMFATAYYSILTFGPIQTSYAFFFDE